jgi:hypothetical protein
MFADMPMVLPGNEATATIDTSNCCTKLLLKIKHYYATLCSFCCSEGFTL